MPKIIYAFMYYAVAAVVCFYMTHTRKRWDDRTKNLWKAQLAAFIAVLFYAVSLTGNEIPVMITANNAVYGFVVLIFMSVCRYSAGYVNREKAIPGWFDSLCYSFAFLDGAAALTNPLHHMYFSDVSIHVSGGDLYLVHQGGVFYFIHLAFCYSLMVMALLFLLREYYTIPFVYRGKYKSVLLALLLALASNVLAVSGIIKTNLNISVILYSMLVCIYYHYSFHYEPRKMLCQTRNMIVDHLSTPLALFDNRGCLLDFNVGAREFLGIRNRDKGILVKEEFEKQNLNLNTDSVHTFRNGDMELKLKHRGLDYYYNMNRKNLYDKKRRLIGSLYLFQDISQQKVMYQEIKNLANYDQLTGLSNKNAFLNVLKKMDTAENLPISIVIGNINGLKIINDIFGTKEGDRVINFVVETLLKNIRSQDFVARLDGDETIIVMPGFEEKDALSVIKHVSESCSSCLEFDFEVNIEFGVAIKRTPDENIHDIVKNARDNMYKRKLLNSKSVHSAIVESLKHTLEQSDFETEEHAERTKKMSRLLGERLNLEDGTLNDLSLLAILHDIGKLSIPNQILLKPGPLSDEEWEIMKLHTVKGFQIAGSAQELAPIARQILCHHERWDGTGYPNGLAGEEIPILSRIISVVDAHDVMTHDRPYHDAVSAEEAILELKRCAGTQFDPEIVEVFTALLLEMLVKIDE